MKVGDFVLRIRGEGDAKHGRVIAPENEKPGHWLVVANGRIYRDHENDLSVLQRVW